LVEGLLGLEDGLAEQAAVTVEIRVLVFVLVVVTGARVFVTAE